MTLSIHLDNRKKVYTGTGATDTYVYDWKAFSSSDFVVTEILISTGAETPLALTTDYTVTGVLTGSGTIVLVAGNLPATKKLVIRAKTPLEQLVDLVNTGDLDVENVETALDKLAAICQEQQEEIDRSFKLGIASVISPTLPDPVAGRALVWDATATGIENSAIDVGAFDTALTSAQAAQAAAETAQTAAETAQTAAETAETNAETAESNLNDFINGLVGMYTPTARSTAPTGWLLCYGQAISRTTYSALFAAIGTNFGVGDGSTTFNVPDMRGVGAAGLDNMGGVSANRITDAQADAIGGFAGVETINIAHDHDTTIPENGWPTGSSGSAGSVKASSNIQVGARTLTSDSKLSATQSILSPTRFSNWIIKT